MDGRTDIGTSHYGSKASKMTYGGKGHSVTHPTCSAVLCSAVFHSALLWSATLHSALQCAAPLGGSFVSEKVAMYLQVQPIVHHRSCPITPNWCCCVSGTLHCPCLQITAPAQPPRLMPVCVSGLVFISLCMIPLDRRKDLKDNGEKKRDRAKH